MILRINRINLVGGNREVPFEPGLNIITGPIASGKTLLLRFVRAVLGANLDSLPLEGKRVTELHASIAVGNETFDITRPTVSTQNALVDIAGAEEFARLPFSKPTDLQSNTYLKWLLQKLGLPIIEVPSAPTKDDSEPSPVTINDYLLMSVLNQDSIGFQVFGHHDTFRNIKRKYVFEIIYGKYNTQAASLQEELREVKASIRLFSSQQGAFSDLLADTVLGNKEAILNDLTSARDKLQTLESEFTGTVREVESESKTAHLKQQVVQAENDKQNVLLATVREEESIQHLNLLASQLQAQSERIAKGITAQKHLAGVDFVVCPQCGKPLSRRRAKDPRHCYVCLQESSPAASRADLIKDQQRIESELVEILDLKRVRQEHLTNLQVQRESVSKTLTTLQNELDFQTRAFVTAEYERLSGISEARARLQENIGKLESFLAILERADGLQGSLSNLKLREEILEAGLESLKTTTSHWQTNLANLSKQYSKILQSFDPPAFGETQTSVIDPYNYLPTFHGRRFDTLSSPGLGTLVNVAHALAHQTTSIIHRLNLPNILLIDGLSEHLGSEGLDPKRLQNIYKVIIEISERYKSRLQILLFDNNIPSLARDYVRLRLTENDRLIRMNPDARIGKRRASKP